MLFEESFYRHEIYHHPSLSLLYCWYLEIHSASHNRNLGKQIYKVDLLQAQHPEMDAEGQREIETASDAGKFSLRQCFGGEY